MRSTKQQSLSSAKQALKMLIIAISMAVLWPVASYATYTVAAGTTVTISSSPWHPSGDVIVYGKLQINAGTTVQMDSGARISVQMDGRLKADGTSSSILFTAYGSNHWLGIEILGFPAVPHQPSISDASSMTVSYSYWPSFSPPLTTDKKGAAYLTHCTIEKCNYGAVVGQITPYASSGWINLSSDPYKGHGGGTLYSVSNTYRYIDYIDICLTPFQYLPGKNVSVIQNNNIYCDYNNTDFYGIALYYVDMGDITGNQIISHEITGTRVLSLQNYSEMTGLFTYESGLTFYSNTISGFHTGLNINDLFNSYSKTIGERSDYSVQHYNTFTNNWWDIIADGTYNVNLTFNYSTKDMSYSGCCFTGANINFATISGDNWSMIYNSSVNNPAPSYGGVITPIDIAIWHPDASTPSGRWISENTITRWSTAIQSQSRDFGALFWCNTFDTTAQDIVVTSGGVAPVQRWSAQDGFNNLWHDSCTGSSHWSQNPADSPVAYYHGWTVDAPQCRGGNISIPQIIPPGDWDCSQPVRSVLGQKNYNRGQLDTVIALLAAMPDPGVLDADHHATYIALSLRRDIYLSQIIQYYVDTAFFDSAFYMINAYPCLRANIDKMNLLITIDSAYTNFSGLATSISNGFSLCSSGTGGCDNTYYDDNLSTQAPTYYPMIIDLKKHYFSDSVVDAYHTTLTGMASVNSYYGVVCRKILQLYHDSVFQVYIPHDSTYHDSILYPLVAESIYNWGEPTSSPFTGFPKDSLPGQWKFYPNPANSVLNIAAPEQLRNEKEMPYVIYTELGKEVSSGTFTPASAAIGIDVSQLSKGIYILEITLPQSIEKYNFVKQ